MRSPVLRRSPLRLGKRQTMTVAEPWAASCDVLFGWKERGGLKQKVSLCMDAHVFSALLLPQGESVAEPQLPTPSVCHPQTGRRQPVLGFSIWIFTFFIPAPFIPIIFLPPNFLRCFLPRRPKRPQTPPQKRVSSTAPRPPPSAPSSPPKNPSPSPQAGPQYHMAQCA